MSSMKTIRKGPKFKNNSCCFHTLCVLLWSFIIPDLTRCPFQLVLPKLFKSFVLYLYDRVKGYSREIHQELVALYNAQQAVEEVGVGDMASWAVWTGWLGRTTGDVLIQLKSNKVVKRISNPSLHFRHITECSAAPVDGKVTYDMGQAVSKALLEVTPDVQVPPSRVVRAYGSLYLTVTSPVLSQAGKHTISVNPVREAVLVPNIDSVMSFQIGETTFVLVAIIVHKGMHFTMYTRHMACSPDDREYLGWVYYDDLDGRVRSFEDPPSTTRLHFQDKLEHASFLVYRRV